jgi:hypothetical protein
MPRRRITLAALLGVVCFCGVILAGLRSGSNDAFKVIYTLTFLILVYAGMASRYRGPFWHGFAVAGWALFVVGFGPWIGSVSGMEALRTVNRNLVSSVLFEIVSMTVQRSDPLPTLNPAVSMMILQNIEANRNGITHCALTILFAYVGGLVCQGVARRSREESKDAELT